MRAYDFTGGTWPDGNISMHLQLGQPAAPLLDGSTDWNAVAESALNDWNAQLTRSKFAAIHNSTAEVRSGNRINNVVFRTDVFGTAFGDRTLAVTVGFTNRATARFTEQDVVFNSNLTWNSYRGGLRGSTQELRRVALHEFGHVLGLDHPDKAFPPQSVIAIMNSTVSGIETLMEDDVTGVRTLYDASTAGGNTGANRPVIVAHPQSRTVQVGDSYTLAVTATGTGPFTYTWGFQAGTATEPEEFHLATGASYTIGSVQPVDAGLYTCLVRGPGGTTTSNVARLTVSPGPATSTQTTLANLSTRGLVTAGNGVLIAGIVIGGTGPKPVLVRAAGPALADFGVGGALLDPSLRIVDSATSRTVAENDNWDTGGNVSGLEAAAARLGAFQFRRGSRDAAILANLPPGSYTAVVSGVGDLTGVALVEVYDADADATAARGHKLVNIATRGQVVSGDSVIIAGLVVTGPGPRTYLIRGIGPTLAKPPFNLSDALLDPFLEIYRGETLLRENDDWDAPSNGMPALREAATTVGAFPLMEVRDAATRSGLDAAMLITLPPGSYTAKLSGFEGATGVGLIEIYEVP
ncbi:MAG: immunoglobulin domain-containing protein [Verrucomicrobia bacterium]|nr:immunoglobulin domain-containing protein [Verrucomicrobiota bacterium]